MDFKKFGSDLIYRTAFCTACPAAQTRRQPLVGSGPINSPLVCVMGRPSLGQDKHNDFQHGTSFRKIKKMFSNARIKENKVYYTHVMKCFPGRLKGIYNMQKKCKSYLLELLENTRPKFVVLMGEEPIRHVLLSGSGIKFDSIKNWQLKFFYRPTLIYDTVFLCLPDPKDINSRTSLTKSGEINRIMHSMREALISKLKKQAPKEPLSIATLRDIDNFPDKSKRLFNV